MEQSSNQPLRRGGILATCSHIKNYRYTRPLWHCSCALISVSMYYILVWRSLPTCFAVQEANASYKCMDKNNYNRDACEQYFKAYKECKKAMVRAAVMGFLSEPGVLHRCIFGYGVDLLKAEGGSLGAGGWL